MSTLVNGTVAGDRWIERAGFVVLNAGDCSRVEICRRKQISRASQHVELTSGVARIVEQSVLSASVVFCGEICFAVRRRLD
ncbi:THO complex subunit 2-like [Dorcoceras hygrometricum]|uniref:THO complex subunit 2-like n=1 Tax=Dorcoceras hygrometricum TaxID=472368 RepID=A0A2Z7AYG8_9LAMI|nr:THO complex subunit 2-like [Dorcoceras hygrometricum]